MPSATTSTISESPTSEGEREPLGLPLQTIVSGCPGSGKSYFAQSMLAKDTIVVRAQFHAETSIFDFVGSYKPAPVYETTATTIIDAVGEPFGGGRPIIDYRFLPGPFANALVAAAKNPSRNIVLLIEEINRANAAAVFGELFQLLDRDETGRSRYAVSPPPEFAAYLRSQTALGASEPLRLQPNFYIWATMNNADQGVFPLDTAFRRRWSYRYLGYAEVCAYPPGARRLRFGGKLVDWDRLRGKINDRLIGLGIHEDKLIGPYFLTKEQLADPAEVLNKLLLYLWDDVLRFRQQELFQPDSFSKVCLLWDGGEGLPLVGVDMPEDLSTDSEVELGQILTVDKQATEAIQPASADGPDNP